MQTTMRFLLLVGLLTLAAPARAKGFTVSPTRFEYTPGATDFSAKYWAPNRPENTTGITLRVFGESNTCSTTVHCSSPSCFVAQPRNPGPLIDIAPSFVWSPSCLGNSEYGPSFAAIGPGGIGLYTAAGRIGASQPLLTPGPGGIHALYVSFPVKARGSMRPFSASCATSDPFCAERIQMRVASTQSAEHLFNDPGTQCQQKMALVLGNTAAGTPTREMPARIELTPHTLCSGISCSATNGNVNPCDNTQGCMPWVGGRLPPSGEALWLVSKAGTSALWESFGTETQNQAFGSRDFEYRVSWALLQNTLRQVTTLRGRDGSVDSDVASVFGNGWDDRMNWELQQVRFAQEVYDPTWQTHRASVVGAVSRIHIDALKL